MIKEKKSKKTKRVIHDVLCHSDNEREEEPQVLHNYEYSVRTDRKVPLVPGQPHTNAHDQLNRKSQDKKKKNNKERRSKKSSSSKK
eukprot:CAMPEP_0170550274 /NCGR_PEP_ID=MMETSP0211-20121228/8342_1 /TAXON_ID=311385 /ORGANISM="Pseudokeronopsis sp., Strain OXSARD2" /LENGTH=85 /DNA_ID=CAMNT_0010856729 /DNA_START=1234 /DNA_END=1488 /DNA_ORIENTATION=+